MILAVHTGYPGTPWCVTSKKQCEMLDSNASPKKNTAKICKDTLIQHKVHMCT
jgi:hypothetical protein